MARYFFTLVIVLLAGFHIIAGLPTRNRVTPVKAPEASKDTSDDRLFMREKSQTAFLSDFVIGRMVDQCSGCIDPAVAFYGCIENSTQLPAVWAMMGLNATLMRLQTVEIFRLAQGGNLTEQKSTDVSVIQASSSEADAQQSNKTIMDVFNTIAAQSDKACMNADGLLACLNPYLSACFPDADSLNSVQLPAGGAQGPSSVTSDGTSSSGDDDSSADDDSTSDDSTTQTFFMLPFMETQSQIFPLLQQTFMTMCADNGLPLKTIIDGVPCLFQSMEEVVTRCSACLNPIMVGMATNVTVTMNAALSLSSATPLSEPGGLPLEPELCSGLRDCVGCQLDVVTQTCGQDLGTLLRKLGQIYFNALQCFPNSNDNSVQSARTG